MGLYGCCGIIFLVFLFICCQGNNFNRYPSVSATYFVLPTSTLYEITTSQVETTVGTICYIPVSANLSQCRNNKGGVEEEPNIIDISENASIEIITTTVLRYFVISTDETDNKYFDWLNVTVSRRHQGRNDSQLNTTGLITTETFHWRFCLAKWWPKETIFPLLGQQRPLCWSTGWQRCWRKAE